MVRTRHVSPDEEEIVPAVRAEGIYKIFGKRTPQALRALGQGSTAEDVRALGVTPAVVDVSFEVQPGEIFVVMGLSGSGKSTLIRMLNGLLEPTAGHVEIDGADITNMSAKALRSVRQSKISMVFQHFALFPHRTVLDNAAYGLQMQKVPTAERRKRAREALRLVGLGGWEDHLPNQLSGGMQQRVGLARALASETDILLMDEAFSALDPLIRRDMQTQLLELQARLGKTIVFITHDLNEAMRIGDRIAVMRSGRIVQVGTAEEILNDPANDYVAQFIQDVDRTRVLTASSVMEQPLAVVGAGSGPRAAARTMRENQVGAAFVLSRDRKLVGAVYEDAAVEAARQRADTLSDVVKSDIAEVTPDTPLVELFTPSAENALPLAVVDGDRHLLGVIPRVTLLAALGGGTGEFDQANGTDESGESDDTDEPADSDKSVEVEPSESDGDGAQSGNGAVAPRDGEKSEELSDDEA